MIGIPPPSSTDSDDVIWALQTAGTQWDRGDRRDAAEWLQRAARAAGQAGDDARAIELGRLAAEMLDELDRAAHGATTGASAQGQGEDSEDGIHLTSAVAIAVTLETDPEPEPSTTPSPPDDGEDEVVTSAPPIALIDRGIGARPDPKLADFRAARNFIGIRDAKPFIDAIEREASSAPSRPVPRGASGTPRRPPPPPPTATRKPALPTPPPPPPRGGTDVEGADVVAAAQEPVAAHISSHPRPPALPPPSPALGMPAAARNSVAEVSLEEIEEPPVSLEPVSLEPVSLEPVSLEPVSLEPVSLEPLSLEPLSLEPLSSRRPETLGATATTQAVAAEVQAAPAADSPGKQHPHKPSEGVPSQPIDAGREAVPLAAGPGAPHESAEPPAIEGNGSLRTRSTTPPSRDAALEAEPPPARPTSAAPPTLIATEQASGSGHAPLDLARVDRTAAPMSQPPVAAAPTPRPEPAVAQGSPKTPGPAAVKPTGPERSLPDDRPTMAATDALSPSLDLSSHEAFADLPEDERRLFQGQAVMQRISHDEEVSGFGLAMVVDGEFNVAAMITDVAAARIGRGSVLRNRCTVSGATEVRLVCVSEAGVVATWGEQLVEEAFGALPWVEEELGTRADRVHALVGATLGALGNELDNGLFAELTRHTKVRVLMAAELLVEQGADVPGLVVVGVGELENVEGDASTSKFLPGDVVFASAMLAGGVSQATVRAGRAGAVLLLIDRAVTQELFMTFPPLLDLMLRL